MKNSLSQVSQRAGRIRGYAGGGAVRGPGTGTSDSISAKLSDGEFVLPADTVRKVGVKSLRDLVHATHTPVKAKPGRHNYANGGHVGVKREDYVGNAFKAMEQQREATAQAGQQAAASAQAEGEAAAQRKGGAPEDQPRNNSFGDAAAAASNPGVTQVGAAPAPVATPAAEPAATVANIPQPALQSVPAGANSFGNAAAAARDSSVAQVLTGTQDARTRLLGPDAIPTGGMKAPAPDGSQDNPLNTDIGRNATNTLAALPGAGTMMKAGRMVGLAAQSADAARDIGAVNVAASAMRGLVAPALSAATLSSVGSTEKPAAAAPSPSIPTAEAGAGRGLINPSMADPAKPLPSPAPSPAPQPGYGPIGDRTTLTNEQAATMNPGGRVTVTRNANGTTEFSGGDVSGQVSYNNSSGKALPGGGLNGKGLSGFDVAPAGANVALGPNGSYAFGSGGAQSPSSAAQRSPVGMTVEQAQREGLVGERVGYNPAYDQRLTGVGGRPSAQNTAAADNLAANQEQGARARLMGAGASEPSASGISVPTIQHSGNSWQARQDLKNLETGASSIYGKSAWAPKNYTEARQGAYKAAFDADLALKGGKNPMLEQALREQGATQRTGMQEQGGTARARLLEAGRNDRFGQEQGLAREKFGLEQTAAGYQNRGAQRIEKAQQDLEAAGDDPAKQRSARQRLLGLMGKQDDDAWQGIALQGATDAHGNKTEGVLAALNKRTGDVRRLDQGGGANAPAALPPRDKLVAGQTYQTARGQAVWDGSKFNPK